MKMKKNDYFSIILKSVNNIISDIYLNQKNLSSVEILEESGVEVKRILKSESSIDSLNKLLTLLIKIDKIQKKEIKSDNKSQKKSKKIECIIESIKKLDIKKNFDNNLDNKKNK